MTTAEDRSEATASAEPALSLRWLSIASVIPLAFMLAALLLKPLWRDEYWSLFFAAPDTSLERLTVETHPPLYYGLLHLWMKVSDSELWARALALPTLLLGAVGVYRTMPDKREAAVFLLLSLGSYWVIYFATEIRSYTLLYVLCAMTVAVVARVEQAGWSAARFMLWCVLGAALGMTHYFGGLWFALLSLFAGLRLLSVRKSLSGFVALGLVSVLALVPAMIWVWMSLSTMDMSGQQSERAWPDELAFVVNQFLRGMIAKLIGSNPLVFIAGAGCLIPAFRSWKSMGGLLMTTVIATIIAAVIIHFSFVTLIKERAFIVIMPALIFMFSRAVTGFRVTDGWRGRLARYIPLAAAIMPFLFIPEYFKDREHIRDVTAYLQAHEAQCAGQPLIVYSRPTNHEGYSEMVQARVLVLRPGVAPMRIVPADEDAGGISMSSTCPAKAAALLLPRGRSKWHEAADAAFREAGLDPDALEEKSFGSKRRNILLIQPQDQATPAE